MNEFVTCINYDSNMTDRLIINPNSAFRNAPYGRWSFVTVSVYDISTLYFPPKTLLLHIV